MVVTGRGFVVSRSSHRLVVLSQTMRDLTWAFPLSLDLTDPYGRYFVHWGSRGRSFKSCRPDGAGRLAGREKSQASGPLVDPEGPPHNAPSGAWGHLGTTATKKPLIRALSLRVKIIPVLVAIVGFLQCPQGRGELPPWSVVARSEPAARSSSISPR